VVASAAGSPLGPPELFALLATFREAVPGQPDVLGRVPSADRLSGKLAALSPDDFLEGLLDFLVRVPAFGDASPSQTFDTINSGAESLSLFCAGDILWP